MTMYLPVPAQGASTDARVSDHAGPTERSDKRTGAVTNKSAPEDFPLDEIDLLVGWRAGEDEYLFTKAVAMAREWLLDTEEKDSPRDVLKEILAEAGPPAGNRPLD